LKVLFNANQWDSRIAANSAHLAGCIHASKRLYGQRERRSKVKRVLVEGVFVLASALILALAFISCAPETPEEEYQYDGFGMCADKTAGFPCFDTKCKAGDTAKGRAVFSCLDKKFTAPGTMNVYFLYKAKADTCYNAPSLDILVDGVLVGGFPFGCNDEGSGSISIAVTEGQTLDDISFELFSGDWASSVCIERITFTP